MVNDDPTAGLGHAVDRIRRAQVHTARLDSVTLGVHEFNVAEMLNRHQGLRIRHKNHVVDARFQFHMGDTCQATLNCDVHFQMMFFLLFCFVNEI